MNRIDELKTQQMRVPEAPAPSKVETAYKRARPTVSTGQGNFLHGERNTGWRRGTTPTAGEVLARIGEIGQQDRQRGDALYEQYMGFTSDPTTPFYAPYLNATNGNIAALAELGVDVSGGITPEWIERNSYLMQYYNPGVSGTPTSGGTPQNKAAYYYYQILKDEETTAEAEREMAALQDEFAYWAGRTDRNYSDEEILGLIDWSDYSTLTGMQEAARLGTPKQLNRGVGFTGDYSGMLWAARNGGGSGNPLADMANASRGVGTVYEENPEITARLDPTSGSYNPYVVGSTMDDETRFFRVESFNGKWLEDNRGRISDAQAQYERVFDAEDTTAEAERELASLWGLLCKYARGSEEELLSKVDGWLQSDRYPTLRAMRESLETGDLLPTTRAIDFDIEGMVAEAVSTYRAERYAQQRSDDRYGGIPATGALADDATLEARETALYNALPYVMDYGSPEEQAAVQYGTPEGLDADLAQMEDGSDPEAALQAESADYYARNYFATQAVLEEAGIDTSSLAAAEATYAERIAHLESLGLPTNTREMWAIRDSIAKWRAMEENVAVGGNSAALRDMQIAAEYVSSALPQANAVWAENAAARSDLSASSRVYTQGELDAAHSVINEQRKTIAQMEKCLSGMENAEDYSDQLRTMSARLDYQERLVDYGALRSADDFESVVADMRSREYEHFSAADFLLKTPEATLENYQDVSLLQMEAYGVSEEMGTLFAHTTVAERDLYAYILGTEGEEAAQQYLDFLLDDSYGVLWLRRYESQQRGTRELAEELPSVATVMSVLASPAQVLGNFAALREGETNPYDPLFDTSGFVGTTRATVNENMDSDLGRILYNAATSIGDSLLSATLLGGLPGGGTATALFMGLESSSAAMQQAKMNGATEEQAVAVGVASFIAESVTELMPMDEMLRTLKAGDIATWTELLTTVAKQSGSEFLGEAASEILTGMSEDAIMGELSSFNRAVDAYVAQGMTQEAAEQLAMNDFMRSVLESGITGLIAGGGQGVVSGLFGMSRSGPAAETVQQKASAAVYDPSPRRRAQWAMAGYAGNGDIDNAQIRKTLDEYYGADALETVVNTIAAKEGVAPEGFSSAVMTLGEALARGDAADPDAANMLLGLNYLFDHYAEDRGFSVDGFIANAHRYLESHGLQQFEDGAANTADRPNSSTANTAPDLPRQILRLLTYAGTRKDARAAYLTAALERTGQGHNESRAAALAFLTRYGDNGVTALRQMFREAPQGTHEDLVSAITLGVLVPESLTGFALDYTLADISNNRNADVTELLQAAEEELQITVPAPAVIEETPAQLEAPAAPAPQEAPAAPAPQEANAGLGRLLVGLGVEDAAAADRAAAALSEQHGEKAFVVFVTEVGSVLRKQQRPYFARAVQRAMLKPKSKAAALLSQLVALSPDVMNNSASYSDFSATLFEFIRQGHLKLEDAKQNLQAALGTAVAKADRAEEVQRAVANGALAELEPAQNDVRNAEREVQRMNQQLDIAKNKAAAAADHLEATTAVYVENPTPQNAGALQQAANANNAALISVQQHRDGVEAAENRLATTKTNLANKAGQLFNRLRREAGARAMTRRAAEQAQAQQKAASPVTPAQIKATEYRVANLEANKAKGKVKSGEEIMLRLVRETRMPIDTALKSYDRDSRKDTRGYTYAGTGVAHVQGHQNVSTAVHELTHVVDERFRQKRARDGGQAEYLREQPAFEAVQRTMAQDPNIAAWLGLYPEAARQGEVLAKYSQIWLENPKAAYDMSPEAYVVYEGALRELGLLKAFRQAQKDYTRRANATLTEQAAAENKSLQDIRKTRKLYKPKPRMSNIVGKVSDRTSPFRHFVRDVEKLTGQEIALKDNVAEVLSEKDTRIANTLRTMREETLIGPDGKELINPETGKPYGSLMSILHKVPADLLDDVNTLWRNLDSIDRERAGKGNTGRSIKDMMAVVNDIMSRNGELYDVQQELHGWLNALQKAWVVDPVTPLTQAVFAHMTELYPNYAPGRKAFALAQNMNKQGSEATNPAKPPVESATGGNDSDTLTPIDGLLLKMEQFVKYNANLGIVRAFDKLLVEARASRLVLGIADEVQMPARVEAAATADPDVMFDPTTLITGDGIINVPLPDGTYRSWKLADEYRFLIPAMFDDPKTLPAFFRGIKRVTRFVSASLTTWKPTFALKNMAADSETTLTTGYGPRTRLGLFFATLHTMGLTVTEGKKSYSEQADWFRDYRMRGDIGARYSLRNPQKNADFYRAALGKPVGKRSAKQVAGDVGYRLRKIVSVPTDGLMNFLDGAVRATQARLVNVSGLDAESAAIMRGKAAREATVDTTKRGTSPATQYVSSFVPFFNPAVQGMTKTLALFADPKTRKDRALRFGLFTAENIACGVFVRLIQNAVQEALWSGSEDEWEEYQKLTDYERSHYWHIPIPGTDTALRLRKSQDFFTVIAGIIGDTIADVVTGYEGDELAEAWGAATEIAKEAFLFFDPESSIFQPILNVSRNEDTFGRAIDDADWSNVSPRYLASPDTTAVHKALAQTGLFGWSPDDWQYLSEQYFGSAGTLANSIVRLIEKAAGDEGEDASGLLDLFARPFEKALLYDPNYSNGLSGTFYEHRDVLERIIADARIGETPTDLRAGMTQEEVDEAIRQAEALLSDMSDTRAGIRALYDEYNAALSEGDQDEADRLRSEINHTYFMANARMGDWFTTYTRQNDGAISKIVNAVADVILPSESPSRPLDAFFRMEDTFRSDYESGEEYMERAYGVWSADPGKAALPEPKRQFTVTSDGVSTEYTVPDELWSEYVTAYHDAYMFYVDSIADWDDHDLAWQRQQLQRARRAGNEAARAVYPGTD